MILSSGPYELTNRGKKPCGLPQMLDGHVDEPGTQRPGFLARVFSVGLHDGPPCMVGRNRLAAARRAASRARPATPASKLRLWQFGRFRFPSSVWAATLQPPAQTGMKAQPSHSRHAAIASNRRDASV